MNKQELQEAEEFFLTGSQYGIKETGDKLIAEIRRLNEKIEELECEVYEWKEKAYIEQMNFLEVNGDRNMLKDENQRLTRTKEAFNIGTMALDDFVEVDENLTEELVELFLEENKNLIEEIKILNEINAGLAKDLDSRKFSFKQYMVALQDNQRYKETLELILEQTEYDSSYIGKSIFTEVTKTLRGETK